MVRTNFAQRRWTGNELAILREGVAAKLPIKAIARQLNRSPQSVAQKKNGLALAAPYIKYTARHSFYVTTEMDAAIHRKAYETGFTASTILRMAVAQFIGEPSE